MIIECADLAAMGALGERIAARLQPGDIIALSGGLGAGKTTLARAILNELGHKGEVPSPTFTIVEMYEGDGMRIPAVHADFYRLDDPSEVQELGLEDYREGAVLIAEWPDHAGGFADMPECLSITLEIVGEGRQAIVESGAAWQRRSL